MTNPSQTEQDEVFRFTARYVADAANGSPRSLEEYLKDFPAFPDLIRSSFLELQSGEPAGDTEDPRTVERQERDRGRNIGPYRIVRELGRGGQGIVYLAEDPRLQRRVALKILRGFGAESDVLRARLTREGEATSRLDDPGICTVYEVGSADGTPYIAMRFIDGKSLSVRIAEARSKAVDQSTTTRGPTVTPSYRSRAEVMSLVAMIEKVGHSLHKAHEAGLVHRDIKPGNIMLTESGEPVILDFGLVQDESSGDHTLTRTGDLLGTPAYMSPEQLSGERPSIDRRTDVYSLGATLYECVTLERPFEAATREKLYQAILTTSATPPHRLNPGVPRELATVIETALEKVPNRRYQSAREFALDLQRIRTLQPIHARPTPLGLRVLRWVQRNRAAASIMVIVTLSLIVAITLLRRSDTALRQLRIRGLITASEKATLDDPILGLVLARLAEKDERNPQTLGQLHRVVAEPLPILQIGRGGTRPFAHGIRAEENGHVVALHAGSAEYPGEIAVFDAAGIKTAAIPVGPTFRSCEVASAGNRIALLSGNRVRIHGTDGEDLGGIDGVVHVVKRKRGLLVFHGDQSVARYDWDGKRAQELKRTPSPLSAVTVTDDALVIGCRNGTIQVRSFDGKTHEYSGPSIPTHLAVSRDAGLVAVQTHRGGLYLWDLGAGQHRFLVELDEADAEKPRVVRFELSPLGNRVLTHESSGVARLYWTSESRRMDLRRPEGDPVLWELVFGGFAPDGGQFFTVYQDGAIALWSPDGRHVQTIRDPEFQSVRTCQYLNRGQGLLVSRTKEAATIFDRQGNPVLACRAPGHTLNSHLSADERFLLTAGEPTCYVWDLRVPELPIYRIPSGPPITSLVTFEDGSIATGTLHEARCRIFHDPTEPPRKLVFPGVADEYSRVHLDLAASGDGKWLLTGSPHPDDRVPRIWDTTTWQIRTELVGHEAPVFSVTAADGEFFSGSMDGTAKRWNLAGECISTYKPDLPPKTERTNEHAVFGIRVHGDLVVTTHGDWACRLWKRDGELLHEFATPIPNQRVTTAAHFLPDGKSFVAGYEDSGLRFWALDGTEIRTVLEGRSILKIRVSPTGDRIACGTSSGLVCVLSLDGELLAEIPACAGEALGLCFSWDGKQIHTSSTDAVVRTWFVYADDLCEFAERRALRGLTDGERQRYASLLNR